MSTDRPKRVPDNHLKETPDTTKKDKKDPIKKPTVEEMREADHGPTTSTGQTQN